MAFSLNRAMIIGNITRDPESRTTPTGQTVANFGVATNRRWKDQATNEMKEAVEFHNVVAWGKLAETIVQYAKKGGKIYIAGRIQTRQWDDQTGAKKNRTEIVAEEMILLDRPGAAPAGAAPSAAPTAATTTPTATTPAAPTPPSGEEEINVEDIPF